MATNKQEDYIYALLEELNESPESYGIIVDKLSVQDASDLIEELKFELGWI